MRFVLPLCVLGLFAPLSAQTVGSDEDSEYFDLDRSSPAAAQKLNRLLLHGTLTVHPEFHRLVPPGGSLHLRVVDLRLRRPITFKRYLKVQFPLKYEFRAQDMVSAIRVDELDTAEFYLEALYAPPGKSLYRDRGNQIGGEAWGRMGKPYPLQAGQKADLVLASLWTPQLYSGSLSYRPGALLEGWLDLLPTMRGKVARRNRLTLTIIEGPTQAAPLTNRPLVLAAKAYINIVPQRFPIAFHFFEEDFLVRPINPDWKGFFVARLDSFDAKGRVVSKLLGGRASEKISIGIFVQGLRIVVHDEVQGDSSMPPFDPHGPRMLEELGLETLKPSPITYD